MKVKAIIFFVTILLLVINIVGISVLGFPDTRYVKLVSSIILFICFLVFKGYKHKFILFAFISFLLSDIFMLNYDELLYSKLTVLAFAFAYLFVSLDITPNLKLLKFKPYVLKVFGVIVLLNAYMFIELMSIIKIETKDFWLKTVIYFLGITIGFMALVGGGYNFKYNSTKSTYCVWFIFAFIFAIIFNTIAFYTDLYFVFYLNRGFYVIGLGIMTLYAVLDFKLDPVGDD